jgi:hypothetical protein
MSTRKSPFNRIKDMIPSIIERRAAINKTLTVARSKKESPNEGSLRRRKAKMAKVHEMPLRTRPLSRFLGTMGNANNAVLKRLRNLTGRKPRGAKQNSFFMKQRGKIRQIE